MKLSLAWIFDHIDADWKQQDVETIVARFNQTTAEIEAFYKVSFDLSHFFLGVQSAKTAQSMTLVVPELSKEVTVPLRAGTGDLIPEGLAHPCFMIKKEGDKFRWATLADFGVEKDGLLSALDAAKEDLSGGWRTQFESEDYILEVDNKSITHRPDMWGHRGFAREIAAFMNLPLRDKKQLVKDLPVQTFEHESKQTQSTPFVIKNQAPQACSRFAGLFFKSIENRPSSLLITSRLLKIGSRPINALIDLSNYVTFDWSQPVHLYDATRVDGKQIVVRMAREGEKITLLDGTTVALTGTDLVIADDKKPLCLAGVMGGAGSGIEASTTSVFFEAATFDAGFVRRTAQRCKTRTDSSMRFEKTLDPNQTIEIIERFVQLLERYKMRADYAQEIVLIGKEVPSLVIEVTHDFLEKRSGVTFSDGQIETLLKPLGFGVLKSFDTTQKPVYLITVPSFRASKDIKIKEDILEEVVRCYGFEKIGLTLPLLEPTPFDFSPMARNQKIKYFLAHAAHMIEQQSYAMFDEQFIATLGLLPHIAVSVVNPVSENYYRMATSLVPGLLKNIKENHVQRDQLAFFESARVWQMVEQEPVERKQIAGVFFKKRSAVDFYQCKYQINNLFAMLGFNQNLVTWKKLAIPQEPWYQAHQSAELIYESNVIGVVGKCDPAFLSKLDIGVESDAFIFELDADFLLNHQPGMLKFAPLSKFQETSFDVSLFVPLTLETATIKAHIAPVHALIKKVELVDFFEKMTAGLPRQSSEGATAGAAANRSLTFRIWLGSDERTLEKIDLDSVRNVVVSAVEALGATVRI